MALKIDTLYKNKAIFNPNESEDYNGDYGIWDLTRASISYSKIRPETASYIFLPEYYQMRPDLIAQIKLGDQGKVGSLLKYNGISNPFALMEGNFLAIPTKRTIDDSYSVKKTLNQATSGSNTNTNPNEIFKKNQEKKKYKVSEGRKKFLDSRIKNKPALNLPPNVLQPGETQVESQNGLFIFGANSGGGGANTPTNQ